MGKPLVSICCITYNHEAYIRDCLEGFMMQQTNFPFEVLIHDDASTDHTADIIREYEAKYPDIVKPICQTENQYSEGVNPDFAYNFPRAQGKYLAFCEGDDFWTDAHKLQRQVECFEKYPNVGLVFHRVCVVKGDNIRHNCIMFDGLPFHSYFWKEICSGKSFVHTSSSMISAASLKKHQKILFSSKEMTAGDTLLFLCGSLDNNVVFINKEMSAYRVIDESASHSKSLQGNWKYLSGLIKCYPVLIDLVKKVKPYFSIKLSDPRPVMFYNMMLQRRDESCRDEFLRFFHENNIKMPTSIVLLEWLRNNHLSFLRKSILKVIMAKYKAGFYWMRTCQIISAFAAPKEQLYVNKK